MKWSQIWTQARNKHSTCNAWSRFDWFALIFRPQLSNVKWGLRQLKFCCVAPTLWYLHSKLITSGRFYSMHTTLNTILWKDFEQNIRTLNQCISKLNYKFLALLPETLVFMRLNLVNFSTPNWLNCAPKFDLSDLSGLRFVESDLLLLNIKSKSRNIAFIRISEFRSDRKFSETRRIAFEAAYLWLVVVGTSYRLLGFKWVG